MNDQEAHDFYADPANLVPAGPGRKRQGQRLTSMTAVRFAPEVIEAVKGIAFAEGITVGAWVRRCVTLGLEREARRHRPSEVVPGSGRTGPHRHIPSSLGTFNGTGRTFACPHLSIGNSASASCGTCGPLRAVS